MVADQFAKLLFEARQMVAKTYVRFIVWTNWIAGSGGYADWIRTLCTIESLDLLETSSN